MCRRLLFKLIVCGGAMLCLSGPLLGAVVGVGTVVMDGKNLVSATTANGYTVTARMLKNGTTTAPNGEAAQYPPPLADDLDFGTATSNIYPLTTVNFGGGLWMNTNGDSPDFFIFEAAGGKDVTDFRAIFPDDSVGQPLIVQTASWVSTGVTGATNFGTGQVIAGIAFSITDLRDAAGNSLPGTAVIKGIRVGQSNTGVDPVVFAAVVLDVTAATNPVPANRATDVPRDVVLGWTAADTAQTHDVYLGTDSATVGNAATANPLGVLVSPGQSGTTYEPAAPLAYGQAYYWRVDEVNAPPDSTVFKGDVWSFTVEPYAYPIKTVTATASSSQAGMGPQNAVNGSGLNAQDQHSTELTHMWLSGGVKPTWIQFQFDQVHKLHEMWVWNSNQLIESVLGFGAKDVTIEYSVDGAAWTPLAGVPEFARAPGLPTYTHDTVVNFGGVSAKYVKLTINSSWSGAPQASLSEVRFFSIPVQAREPVPAAGATGIELDATLNWRPGREAASHKVYFGKEQDAVVNGAAPVQTVADHSFSPASMDFGATYFWRVDEVNDAAVPSVREGLVWSFTTQEYAVIDDMESYNDDDNRIYQAWVDGVTTGLSGSTVGYFQAPFAEKTIVHGGKQSMPFEYNNVNTPFYSEAEQEFDTAQNWMLNGANTLSLWIRGVPAAYVEEAGTITMSAAGHDIWDNADDFRYAYKSLNGDGSVVVKVESLVNTNNWAKAGVMIRQNLDADSKFVYMIESFNQGVSMGWRPQVAAACGSATQAGITAPQWVKLTRKGDVFTAQYSADGKTWTDLKAADGTIASTTVAMTNPVYVGLCVTSHNVAATTTAVLSGATTTGNLTGGSWQVQAIGDDPQPANVPADLYVTVQDSAGKKGTATHPAAVATAAWTQWKIPLTSLTGVNLKAVKKLILGVDSRTSPSKGGGMIYIDDIGFGRPAGK